MIDDLKFFWWDDLKFFGGLALAGILILASVVFFVWGVEKVKCTNRAEGLGVEYHYELLGGCQFKIGDRYVPEGNYRVVGEER
jgi:hypothetical protein